MKDEKRTMIKRWKRKKIKRQNEDNVGKTRFLSLWGHWVRLWRFAHKIQYQLILLDSLSLFTNVWTLSGLGNSRDPNTLSDLCGIVLPQTSAWANSIITTFDRFCDTWTLSCSWVPNAQSRCGALRIEVCGWPTNIAKHVNENKRKIASSLPWL